MLSQIQYRVQKFVIFSMNNLGYHFCCGFIKYVYPDTDPARGLEKSDPDQVLVLTFFGIQNSPRNQKNSVFKQFIS